MMRKYATGLVVACAGLSLTAQSRAGITSTTYADQANFNGTPAVNTTPAASNTQTTFNSNGYFQLTNTATSGDGDIVSQTINPATTFTLGGIDVYLAGAPVHNISVHIFASPSGGATSDGYVTPGAGVVDLLNPTNNAATEQTFNFYGSGGNTYESLSFTGAQQITLNAGTKYDIEFWSDGATVSGDGTTYFRDSAGDAYAGGSAYQNKTGSAGYANTGNYRGNSGVAGQDIALAVYAAAPTPEPASLSLLGVGALGMLRRRRA